MTVLVTIVLLLCLVWFTKVVGIEIIRMRDSSHYKNEWVEQPRRLSEVIKSAVTPFTGIVICVIYMFWMGD